MQNKTSSVKKFHESFKIGYNNSPVADLGKEKHKLRFDLIYKIYCFVNIAT